ncbi:MAG: hypothetical protein UEM14_11845 [Faecalibacterium prausnitzii]|jgi:hypothetical protein|nr:hypothetical protein [Faecalibacterium prausnitzii]
MEIKILIEAPELAAAVNNLATAVSNFGEIKVQPVINAADVTDKAVKQTRRRKSDKSAAEEVPAQVEAPGVQTPDAPATAPVEPPHTVPGPAPVPPLTPASEAPVAPVAQQPVAPIPAPVAQAPVANPIPAPVANPIPAVQQSVTAAPVTSVSQTVPPVTTGSPVTEQPQPRQYTMQDIAKVGAALLDKGMMPQLSAILNEMGVMAIPQLRPEQYPVVAEKLIALGGKFD